MGKDIIEKQIDSLIAQIESMGVGNSDRKINFESARQRLDKINKEDLIDYIIFLKLQRVSRAVDNNRDLNARVGSFDSDRGRGNGITLRINRSKAGASAQ